MTTHGNRRPRKVLTRSLIAALAATLTLAGCGGEDDGESASGTTTLKVLEVTADPSDQEPWRKFYDQFEEDNPSIKVDLSFIPLTNYGSVLKTRLIGGNAPDLFHIGLGKDSGNGVWDLAPTGRVMPLDDGQPAVDNIPPFTKPLAEFEGKTYAWFNDLTGVWAFYNKDIYAKAGVEPPTTFDGVLDVCKAIREETGKPAFVLAGGLPQAMYMINFALSNTTVLGSDPDWNTKRFDGETTFQDTPGWTTQFEQYLAMRDADCFQPNPVGTQFPEALNMFTKGEAATMVVTSIVRGSLLSNPELPLGSYALPGSNDPSQTRLGLQSTSGVAISSATKHKEQSLELLNWLAEPENNRLYGEVVGGIAITEATAGNLPTDLELLKPYFTDPEKAVVLPLQYWPAETAAGVLAPDMQSMFLGDTTIPEALANLDRSYDQ